MANEIRDHLHQQRFDLYRPVKNPDDPLTKVSGGRGMKFELAESSVRGQFVPYTDADSTGVIGRVNVDQMDTTDRVHLPASSQADGGWTMRMVTPGHPETGTWYVIQGGPQVFPDPDFDDEPGVKVFLIKKSLTPVIVT